MGAGVAGDEVGERRGDRVGVGRGQPERDGDAEAVAQPRRVVGRGHAGLARDGHVDDAMRRPQLVEPGAGVGPGARRHLVDGEGPEHAEQVVHPVGVARRVEGAAEPLQLGLEVGQHLGVEQLAQLLGAEQLGQQLTIERERGDPALGERGVAVVQVGGHPVEHQGLRPRRRPGGVDRDEADLAAAEVAQQLLQRRQVEDVVQALAGGLEEHREGGVGRGDRQQVGGALALLPQRRALPGTPARDEQRPGRGLAEAGREHGRGRQRRDHDVAQLVGVDGELLERQLVDGLGQADGQAVVAPEHVDLDPPPLGQPVPQGHGPRRVDLRAERGQHAHPPVADLVAEPLDHDGAVVGHGTGGGRLVGQVEQQVRRGQLVEPGLVAQVGGGLLGRLRPQRADQLAHGPTQLDRAARAVAVPERHLPRQARCRHHHHPVVGDLVDAPGGGAQQEGLARAALVDHLLVELAHPGAVGQEDAVEPTVGDGAAVRDGQALGTGPAAQGAREAVPHQPRAQLGELLRRVAAAQQVEHRGEHLVGHLVERRGPAHQRGEVVDLPLVERHHGHDLLGQHVERVARHPRLLDQAGLHARHDGGHLEQVGAVAGEDLPPARLAHLVPGAAHALQPPADRTRRPHLHHQVDRTHVDAQLERRGGDEAAHPPGLEVVLDHEALLAADGAVVGAHQVGGQGRRRAVGLGARGTARCWPAR